MKEAVSTPWSIWSKNLGVFEFVFESTQQEATIGPKFLATTPRLKTGVQVAQNDRGANAHHHKQVRAVLSRLAHSMADLVSKNDHFHAVFRTIVLPRLCFP